MILAVLASGSPALAEPTTAVDRAVGAASPTDESRPTAPRSSTAAGLTAAADPVGCGYGEGGQFADTICWLDMSGYSDTQARTTAGQNMTVTLPGGYTLTYNIKTTQVPGNYTASGVTAVTTPIERQADGNSRFAFGSEAYRNIPGRPSLYSSYPSTGTTGLDVTLSGIRLADAAGNQLSSYSFVATDTEDNVNGESLRWTSDKQLNLLETLYPVSRKGCRPAGISGLGTTEVNCVGTGGASSLAEKSTSILVSADAPSSFALRWITGARSGIAFGIQTSSIEIIKNVDGRASGGDSFDVSVSSPEGSTLATATTGTANTTTTGPVVVVPSNDDDPFTLTDAATPGSGTDLADYTPSWSCTRNGEPDVSLPSGEHTSIQVAAGTGDQVVCTVTNTAGPFDRGDAPVSYGTLLADLGPAHRLVGYDAAAGTANLMLGAKVDDETDGAPMPDAGGDDAAGADDEDAVTSFVIAPGATTASLTVPVVNATAGPATLFGWVDANRNGSFQAGEAATAVVPDGATSATLSWAGLPPAVDGTRPVLRLRLTTETLTDDAGTTTDERSQGAAADGEVEDSLATVATALPDECANPFVEDFGAGTGRASLPAGQTTYTYANSGAVVDGTYALTPGVDTSYGWWWHTGPDHTPGDTNGRLMLINASLDPGKFFSKTFTDLSPGTEYDFSAWITNANNAGSPIKPDVTFRVVDPATGDVITSVSSGSIAGTAALTWHQHSLKFTATQTTVRLELVNNARGGSGNDLAIDDVAVAPVCEYGDAPDSYGTLLSSGGPVHGRGAPHLGATVDYEGDGQPTVAADGDEANGADDEDGVTFNPQLDYTEPTIRTGRDAITFEPVVNHLSVTASAAGFASVWVDWNLDGDFADADERVADAQPVTAGDNDITFSRAVNTTGNRTYVRVRYSTDSSAIHSPTGAAPDGEIEDYRVTVETGPVVSCATQAALFNTAYDGNGGKLAAGDRDANWDAGVGMPSGPASVTSWIPAWVVTGPSAWDRSPYQNADWISYYQNTVHSGNVDVYFRYRFRIDPAVPLDSFALPMSFYADNSVPEVWVNDIPQSPTQPGLPQSADTYQYVGFKAANRAETVLSEGFQHGRNTIVVRVSSGAPNQGFMAQMSLSPLCTDAGDAPDSYGTAKNSDGASHALVGFDGSTHTADLMLGSSIDADVDGMPGAAANGDDADGTDDEDGVVDPIKLTPGESTTVAVTATNETGAPATLVGWLDTDGSGTFDTAERITVTVDPGTATYSLSFPAGPLGTTASYARFRLFPGAVADASPTGPATAGEVEDHPVTVLTRELDIEKTSTGSAGSRPGDVVTYTITATNVGDGAYTAANPARVVDDLAAVLDDAEWNDDAAATVDGNPVGMPSFTSPRLLWSGPLAADETVEITYTVTLKGGGDGRVRNLAWAPPVGEPPGPRPDCEDPNTTVPCAGTELLLPRLSIVKRSSHDALPARGELLTYTVVVTNMGPGDYTAEKPATFVDDLTEVLDDAEFVDGSITQTAGQATYAAPNLSWSGVLKAGDDPATVTYQVRYTGDGDTLLDNSACVPEQQALDPALACGRTTTPGSGLDQAKTASPASGTAVESGDEITYTLWFANTGQAAATVDTVDDLSAVVDDADVLVASIEADTGLTATYEPDAQRIVVTGSVPVAETLRVRYTVRVRAYDAQEDHELRNALACQPGDPPTCEEDTTEHRVRHLTVGKTSDAPADVDTGDQVTYTVTVRNDGIGHYTVADPASVVDDLSDVLDDATFDVDDVEVTGGGSFVFDRPKLIWTGPLPADGEVTITYTVTVTNLGDHDLVNVVTGVRCTDGDDACAPPPVETLLPHVVPSKTSDPASGTDLGEGDLVTYTLSWHNDGGAAGVVDGIDDLSGVLDDAELVDGPTSSSPAVTATFADDTLRTTGPIGVDETVTVTYLVRVLADGERGDNVAGNVLTPDTPQVECDDACEPVQPPATEHRIGELEDWKTADPRNGRAVGSGDKVTYTLHFRNTGTADVEVARDDVLTGVLDDAVLVRRPTASAPALRASRPRDGRFTVTGVLAPDQAVRVSYTVRVKLPARQGDRVLANALLDHGQAPPQGCSTTHAPARSDADSADFTCHRVKQFDLVLDKRVVGVSRVTVGDPVRYRIQVANRGPDAAPGPLRITDRLPHGLELRSAHGRGWRCRVRAGTDTVTCVRATVLRADRRTPWVFVTATTTRAVVGRRVVNTATLDGAVDRNVLNNRDAAAVEVENVPPPPSTGFRYGIGGGLTTW